MGRSKRGVVVSATNSIEYITRDPRKHLGAQPEKGAGLRTDVSCRSDPCVGVK
jgi:hypothetical protein